MIQLPFTTHPRLENERVYLRSIESKDIPALVPISYYDAKPAKDADEAAWMQDLVDQDILRGETLHWGIFRKEDHSLLGTCGYYRGFENESGELGCVLLTEFRGKGYMSDALHLATQFGQNTLMLQRIWAATDQTNHKAIRLLEKNHFVQVGSSGDEVVYEFTA